ncbi:MAG: hypothetical protein HYX24_01855 [Candidatus Aenigmarchaeota archaeon]|nr:hypothetical protein [Candidatus Aenigmarchaeota archaeon]
MPFKLAEVLRQRKHAAIAVLAALLFFSIYVYSQVLFIAENLDIWFAHVPITNLFLLLLFSIIFGAALSYQLYVWKLPKTCDTRKSAGATGTSAMIGLFIAQCPACASLGALFLPASAFAFFSPYSTILNLVSITLLLLTLNYLGAFQKSRKAINAEANI